LGLRQVLSAAGSICTGTGVLILLFVAYQLWGTGLYTARAQDKLKDDFAARIEEATPTPPPAAPTTGPGEIPVTTSASAPPPPASPTGEAVAIIRIPKLGMEHAVVGGVSPADLRKGPGHYPGTPMPGERGNAAIAGHRTTYGAPFNRLDELTPGDQIEVSTLAGSFTYLVEGTQIVRPDQVEVLAPTADTRLTLTTCHPKYSAKQRLIVTALLQAPAAAPPVPAPAVPGADGQPSTAPAEPAAAAPPSLEAAAFATGRSATPAVAWGMAAALVGGGWWWAVRRRRRWTAYAAGVVPFLAVLFMFYYHLERLLPADF
jgi:sortase A